MDTKKIYESIKQLCLKEGLTINQLEKQLGFGTGTIGKWRQSFPSLDKAVTVADFFGVSVDEIFVTKNNENEPLFLQKLIEDTEVGTLIWKPCSCEKLKKETFSPRLESGLCEEIYSSEFMEGRFYVSFSKEGVVELYVGAEGTYCFKQNEDRVMLSKLWKTVKKKEMEQVRLVEDFKKTYTES